MTNAGRRAGLVTSLGLAVALQYGCAGSGPNTRSDDARASSSVAPGARDNGDAVTEPRSDRGNPPFYDVLGKRYHVLPTSAGYRERGVASWYGRDFHGLSTSSGETYDMHAMTAAHTTLPIPTWVEVTNLENGARVVVKVNDRGPFVDDRIIDLSFAAATKLDMVRNGTTRVEVRAIGAPQGESVTTAAVPGAAGSAVVPAMAARPVATATVAAAPPAAPFAQQIFLQVGAFGDLANATRLVERLETSGFANAFVASEGDGRRALHRVRLGPLRDSREFDQVSARLRASGFGQSQLVTAR